MAHRKLGPGVVAKSSFFAPALVAWRTAKVPSPPQPSSHGTLPRCTGPWAASAKSLSPSSLPDRGHRGRMQGAVQMSHAECPWREGTNTKGGIMRSGSASEGLVSESPPAERDSSIFHSRDQERPRGSDIRGSLRSRLYIIIPAGFHLGKFQFMAALCTLRAMNRSHTSESIRDFRVQGNC